MPTEKAVEIDLVDIRIENVKMGRRQSGKRVNNKKAKYEEEIDRFLDRQCKQLFHKS